MVHFTTTIKKFSDKGEKTGWTYIEIPGTIAQQLKPNNKKTFRVKGKLDNYSFEGLALLPMGDGNFIMALNAAIRKNTGKQKGAVITVHLEADNSPVKLNAALMECIAEEPAGLSFFKTLTPGHQKYFSNWIDSAKTEATRITRIAHTLNALSNHQDYGQMIRSLTNENKMKG